MQGDGLEATLKCVRNAAIAEHGGLTTRPPHRRQQAVSVFLHTGAPKRPYLHPQFCAPLLPVSAVRLTGDPGFEGRNAREVKI